MIESLKREDLFFLKYVKETILTKYNLPYDCISIEYRDEEFYNLHFIMRNVPFEVYFTRYNILEEVEEELKTSLKIINPNKKIFHLRIYQEYRAQRNNLLNFI